MNVETNPRPVRVKVGRLARPFLILNSTQPHLKTLFPLAGSKKSDDLIRIVRGTRSHTVKAFTDELTSALQYQGIYNGNWDVFNEIVNELDWLSPSRTILFIFTDIQELFCDDSFEEFESMVQILGDTATNWETGTNHEILTRAYEQEIVPESTKFTILLHYNSEAQLPEKFQQWLKHTPIPKVGDELFDINITDILDPTPIEELLPLVKSYAPNYTKSIDALLQGEDIQRDTIAGLWHSLQTVILTNSKGDAKSNIDLDLIRKAMRNTNKVL